MYHTAEGPAVYATFNTGLGCCFERSPGYWNGWIRIRAGGFTSERTILLGLRREDILEGYLVCHLPREPRGHAHVVEIAALDRADAPRLLREAGRRAREADCDRMSVCAPHLPPLTEALRSLGRLDEPEIPYIMLRRVNADEATMREIEERYRSGRIVWWGIDGF